MIGNRVDNFDIESIFPAPEGSANLYYGLIRSGKSYGATSDIIDELKQGRVVYATWPIKVKDFDDRESFWFIFKNLVLFRKRYYTISCLKNFHYIDAERGEVDGKSHWRGGDDRGLVEYLNKLNHCSLYIDEAWRVIDSYAKTNFSMESRNLILVTRHKYRTVNLIAQRPTSIHVTARGNMNRFYKFKKLASWPWVRFARYEFQEMTGETVNEEVDPVSKKTYWAKKSIYNAYNTDYLSQGIPKSQNVFFEAYDLNTVQKLKLLGQKVIHSLSTFKNLTKSKYKLK